MDNIKKIRVSGVDYSVYDEQAHDEINSIDASVPAGLTENSEEKKIYLVNKNGENIGEGVSLLVGADGKSAYESAVEGGYDGTEEDFAEQMALVASVVAYNGETEDIEPLAGTWRVTVGGEYYFDKSLDDTYNISYGIKYIFADDDGGVYSSVDVYDTVVLSTTSTQDLRGDGISLVNSSGDIINLNEYGNLILGGRTNMNDKIFVSAVIAALYGTVEYIDIDIYSNLADVSNGDKLLTWLQANATKQ